MSVLEKILIYFSDHSLPILVKADTVAQQTVNAIFPGSMPWDHLYFSKNGDLSSVDWVSLSAVPVIRWSRNE